MKKRLFYLPLLLLVLCACKNPAGPSSGSVAPLGGALKAKVQFDSDKISCYNSSTSQILTPGAEVKEQDTVTFGAKLSGDTVVDEWYVNDNLVQTGGTSYTIYGVGDSHVVDEGGQKLIKVRCTFK